MRGGGGMVLSCVIFWPLLKWAGGPLALSGPLGPPPPPHPSPPLHRSRVAPLLFVVARVC
jgi:hypothetical protein